jgi:RNA polymerase sigma-70 factor (ECF subfamily)
MEPNPRVFPLPSSEAEEVGLLRRVAGGQRSAFDALYRSYWPRLHRFLSQVTHRPQLVDELINDTMLVVWRSAVSFRGDSRLSTWIFAIAYKKALKRMKDREPALPLAPIEEELSPDDPEREAMLAQLRARLNRAMATLSAEQRASVELTYYHGYAYPEIAQIMDCPVDTVKTRMFHARRKLRLLLDAQSEEI